MFGRFVVSFKFDVIFVWVVFTCCFVLVLLGFVLLCVIRFGVLMLVSIV